MTARVSRNRLVALLSVCVASLIASPATGASSHSKLDRVLADVAKRPHGTVRVIVRLNKDDGGRIKKRLRQHGDAIEAEHAIIRGFTARIHAEDLESLATDGSVASVSSDATVYPDAAKKSQTLPGEDLLRATMNLGNSPLTGNFIGVAVIDSGIDPTRDFNGRIVTQYDFVTGGGQTTAARDEFGHGTHVAGLIGGSGALSLGQYMGVAPKVRFISMRVLDRRGAGTTSAVIQAIETAIRQKNTLGIDVINLSLGHPIYESAATDPLVQAVEAAVAHGIVVVVSAGNHGTNQETLDIGYGGITSPGNAPSAITAGAFKMKGTAVRSDDRIPGFSSRGPTWYDGLAKPDIVAPGHKEVSDAALNSELYLKNADLRVYSASGHGHLALSGTSMAAGVTSGAVALILEASRNAALARVGTTPSFTSLAQWYAWYATVPHLKPNAVKALLQFTALPLQDEDGVPYDVLTQGAGGLNIDGALRLAARVDPRVTVDAWWLTAGVEPTTTTAGETLPWAQNIVWSDSVISGDAGFYNLRAWAWSQNIVWSDRSAWGANIVWSDLSPGTLLVNGTNIVWAENIVWSDAAMTTWASNIVWGESALTWAGTSLDPTNIVWGNLAAATETAKVNGAGTARQEAIKNVLEERAISDEKVIWGARAVAAEKVIWGAKAVSGDKIIWGEGNKIIWGEKVVWGAAVETQ